MQYQKQPIGLVMATRLEAKPFLTGLSWRNASETPFPVYHDNNRVLIISGIGKANAAMAAAWLCMQFFPACLVNLGAAGTTRAGKRLGAIYQIRETVEPDRRHYQTGRPFRQQPDVLPGFATARLATLDQATLEAEKRKEISSAAELVDMEGAAVVQAARRFQVPCCLFKFVSDTAAHTTGGEIISHIRQYRQSLFDFFITELLPALKRADLR